MADPLVKKNQGESDFDWAKREYAAGDQGVQFVDNTYGLRNYKDVITPGTLEYKIWNPAAQAGNQATIDQAKQTFKSTTGQDLTGIGLDTVTKHILNNDSADQALTNLGDLKNYTRFSSDYGANQNAHEINNFGDAPVVSAMTKLASGGNDKPFWQGGNVGMGNMSDQQTPSVGTASSGVSPMDAMAQKAYDFAQLKPGQSAPSLAATPNGVAPTAAPNSQGVTSPQGSSYQGNSIIDYLKSVGQKTDFNSRSAMARGLGINNYTGTAAQNTQLLNALRKDGASGGQQVSPGATPGATGATPAPVAGGTPPQGGQPEAPGSSGAGPTDQSGQTPTAPPVDPARAAMEAQIQGLQNQPSSYDQYLKAYQDSGLSAADAKVAADTAKVNDIQGQIDQIESRLTAGNIGKGGGLTQDQALGLSGALRNTEESPLLNQLNLQQRQLGTDQTTQKMAQDKLATLQAASAADQTRQQGVLAAKTALAQYRTPEQIQAAEIAKYGQERALAKAETPTKYYPKTKYSPAGTYDPATGKFTPEPGSTPGGGSASSDSGSNVGTTGNPIIDSTSKGYSTKVIAGGLTQAAIDQAAIRYDIDGVMPSLGLGNTGSAKAARAAIINRGAELDAGGSISANKAQMKALSESLTQQTTGLNTVQRALTNADNGFKQITTVFNNQGINPWGGQFLNKKANQISQQLTGGNINAFLAGLQEVATEYANVFSRGGSLNQATQQRAQDIINGNLSMKDLASVQQELQTQGKIVVQGYKDQVGTIQQQINDIIPGFGQQQNSKTSSSSGSDPLGIL